MDSETSMFLAGLVVGGLWGALLVVFARWAGGALRRSRLRRRQRKASRSARQDPLPLLWATGAGYPAAGGSSTARRAHGGIDDDAGGPRNRPTYNPDPGPRDW